MELYFTGICVGMTSTTKEMWEFPGTITGTTGKFLYKNIEDVSVNTSWFFDVDYQSTIDISRVVLVNNNLANYPYLTETKSVALFSNSDNYYYWDGTLA